MHFLNKITGSAFLVLFLAACGASGSEPDSELNKKKTELDKLRVEQSALNQKITELEKEIINLDPDAGLREKPKLVAVKALEASNFSHYVDLQGTIDAEDISYIAPKPSGAGQAGGYVTELYIKEGSYVKKGQLIMKLDDAIIRQQMAVTKNQLEYAEDLYNRQKNLWDQNIGTEVQLINAKNNVENLKRQLAVQDEQLKSFQVYSDVNGVADEVNIRVGEFFQGMGPTGPQIKIVNTSNLKAVTEVPENYLSKVKKGGAVEIVIPDLNKTIQTKINLISKSIDPNSRSFTVEANIPTTPDLKPNQLILMKILDHASNNALVVPVNIIQSDEKGKFVYVLVKEGEKEIARKKSITIGDLYDERIEVLSGLEAGDQLITQGYQNLYDGQLITTTIQ